MRSKHQIWIELTKQGYTGDELTRRVQKQTELEVQRQFKRRNTIKASKRRRVNRCGQHITLYRTEDWTQKISFKIGTEEYEINLFKLYQFFDECLGINWKTEDTWNSKKQLVTRSTTSLSTWHCNQLKKMGKKIYN